MAQRSRTRKCALEALEDRRVLASGGPVVANASPADVGSSSATVGGEVVRVGVDAPAVTLYWGDNDGGVDAGQWDHAVSLGAQEETFALQITGLESQRAYYYRSFAENSVASDWANTSSLLFTEGASIDGAAMYNDHVATPVTHVNATTYAGNGVASGLLKDLATGQPTGVTLSIGAVGVDYFSGSGIPTEGTDADEIFGGVIGFAPGIVAVTGSDSYRHTFSGLESSAMYDFAGTAVRGNDNYTNRWTRVTLVGADQFTPAHSSGDGVITSGLPDNQMVFWAGANHNPDQGYVARWTDIDPGLDGEFEIVSTQYTGAVPTSIDGGGVADGNRSYALAAVRLVESFDALVAVGVDPAPGAAFGAPPAAATFDFNKPVDPATLDAADLTVNGVAATSVVVVDADTVQWTLPAGLAAGDYTLDVAAGAVASVDGDAFLGYSAPFSIAALPDIDNAPPTDLLATSVSIGAEVASDGFAPPHVLLYWGAADGAADPNAWDHVVDLGAIDGGADYVDLADLSPGAEYFYRTYAANPAGEVWAAGTSSFTMPSAELPVVAGSPPLSIGAVSALLAGEVVDIGNDVPEVRVFFGTVDGGADPNAWHSSVSFGLQSGAFSGTVSGLLPETQYFYRFEATNAAGSAWADASASLVTASVPTLVINEIGGGDSDFLTTRTRSNSSAPYDGVPITPDWIEIRNLTAEPVALVGLYLTDNAENPTKWAFPADAEIPSGGYTVVYASGENIVDDDLDQSGRFHTNFELNNNGEYLALTAGTGSVLFEHSPEFAELKEGFTYGLDGQGEGAYFSVATPMAANNDGSIVPGFVADTEFSIDRGFFTLPIVVDVTSDTLGATIAYTTDGSEPTLSNGTQVAAANASTAPLAPVNISTTTVLRARAYLPGWVETNVDTQTYLYLNDVVQQPAFPSGFPTSWGGAPAVDYGMDPQIVNNPAYSVDLLAGLREIPTLSVTLPVEDLFGPAGIYSNTNNSSLEAPAAAELILPDGSSGFQVDAGLKVQGGASRNPNNSPKHALSLRFRDSIGDGKLEYPLFPGSPVTSFDSLQLRSRYNNSWIHWSESQRNNGTLIRDVWMRDTLLDMGQVDAGQGALMHLYLNGLYWGVYEVEERPEASHYAAYHGGDESQYDALNATNPVDGDLNSFNAMVATAASQDWDAIQQVLDVDNFIDFVIMQRFSGNQDFKVNGNWRAAGGGSANAPWRFYSWDAERILESVNENTAAIVGPPAQILQSLRQIEEFRIRFADRLQIHFFHGGALTPEATSQRLLERADELTNAIVAESARWGDYRRDVHQRNCGCDLYTRDEHWQAEVDRLVDNYLPLRSDIVLDQYESDGLLAGVDAPEFQIGGAAQHGGAIEVGAQLSFDARSNVYYTFDGTDPRAEGGAAVGMLYRPGLSDPIVLDSTTRVSARVLSGSTWSALNSTLFAVAPPVGSLAVTELHYHPANHPDLPEEDDQEFIEVLNVSQSPVDLSGVQITQFAATPYVFADGVQLAPGEYIVIARNPTALVSIHGEDFNLAPDGFANRNLSNGGETVALVDPLGNQLLSFTYDDVAPWPESPDGDGPSLEIIDPLGNHNDPANWRASSSVGGSPGRSGEADPGDFDFDGDVDGGDFLAWQRGFGTTTTADDLTDWEDNFGQAAASATQLSALATTTAEVISSAHRSPSSADLRDAALAFWRMDQRQVLLGGEEVLAGLPQDDHCAALAIAAVGRAGRSGYLPSVRAELDLAEVREQRPGHVSDLVDALFAGDFFGGYSDSSLDDGSDTL